jgi:hypothetical protein
VVVLPTPSLTEYVVLEGAESEAENNRINTLITAYYHKTTSPQELKRGLEG